MTATVCVAAGPSFTEGQAELIRAARAAGKVRLLVVNRMWERFPDADVLYAADAKWWRKYWPEVERNFEGECWTCLAETARKYGLCCIPLESGAQGLGRGRHDPSIIGHGDNGGHQLLCKAYRFMHLIEPIEDDPIILVGYDMQHTGGKVHSHPNYPEVEIVDGKEVRWSNAGGVQNYARNMIPLARDLKAEGVRVINCTIETALTCFPRADLAETLAAL